MTDQHTTENAAPGGTCPPACSEHWHVEVSVNGETVLAIGHNFLSGVDDIDQHTETIRTAANHLLGFIGDAQNKALTNTQTYGDEDLQQQQADAGASENK